MSLSSSGTGWSSLYLSKFWIIFLLVLLICPFDLIAAFCILSHPGGAAQRGETKSTLKYLKINHIDRTHRSALLTKGQLNVLCWWIIQLCSAGSDIKLTAHKPIRGELPNWPGGQICEQSALNRCVCTNSTTLAKEPLPIADGFARKSICGKLWPVRRQRKKFCKAAFQRNSSQLLFYSRLLSHLLVSLTPTNLFPTCANPFIHTFTLFTLVSWCQTNHRHHCFDRQSIFK